MRSPTTSLTLTAQTQSESQTEFMTDSRFTRSSKHESPTKGHGWLLPTPAAASRRSPSSKR